MQIRKFKKTDAPKVSQLIRKCITELFPHYYPKKVIDVLYKKNTPKSVIKRSNERDYYVMEEKNHILGIMGIQKNNIRTSYVNPAYHKKGIGRKLLNHLENIVLEKNYSKLTTHSSLSAKTFYQKCGFKIIRKVSSEHEGIMLDEYLMEKKLHSKAE